MRDNLTGKLSLVDLFSEILDGQRENNNVEEILKKMEKILTKKPKKQFQKFYDPWFGYFLSDIDDLKKNHETILQTKIYKKERQVQTQMLLQLR